MFHEDTEILDKEAAPKDLQAIQQKELELWKKWNENGQKPEDLKPLFQSFKPLIRGQANSWANRADLPPQAVHAAFQQQFVTALKTYNPEKASLGTWVNQNLRQGKAQRWVSTYQDPLRVQENRYYKMGAWDNAMATLNDQLGREPTTREVAEHLGWSEAEAGRMEAEKRSVSFGSSVGVESYDPTTITPSKESEALRMVRYSLTPEELQVFDYLGGYYGKPQLKPGEVAKKLNISASKVSRIKAAITKKLEEYLE